jgi:hypothetical protein
LAENAVSALWAHFQRRYARVASLGFNRISVTNYVSASDYCAQHYWRYLRANWISSDPSDKLRIKICMYYDKWQGAQPPEKCSPPVVNPPEWSFAAAGSRSQALVDADGQSAGSDVAMSCVS